MSAKTKPWRIIDLINWGTDRFTKKGISNARMEMEWILCDILNCERIDLYVRFDNLMKEVELEQLRSMIKRRISGEPFQHVIGKAPFYGRDFKVNHNVFVPRPETEIIIDRIKENGVISTLLDIGTGSGCLAITAVLENLADNVYATDVSAASLEVVLDNLKLYEVKCIQLKNHDFLKPLQKNLRPSSWNQSTRGMGQPNTFLKTFRKLIREFFDIRSKSESLNMLEGF